MSVSAGVGGKMGQTKVKRYWPGKAPHWADQPEEQEQADTTLTSSSNCNHDNNSADDPRRRISQAMEEEEEDEDAVEEKRRMIRERLLKFRRQEERDLPTVDEDDDEESEYETDSEEEASHSTLEKPVYFRKQDRETIAEHKRLEEAVKRRKAETKQIVVEKIRQDHNIEMNSLVDEKEDDDEAEEYEKWKAREIARIKRDKEEDALFKEIKRVRRNNMTTATEEIRKNPNKSGVPPKHKRRFMHKYSFRMGFACCNGDYYSAAPIQPGMII